MKLPRLIDLQAYNEFNSYVKKNKNFMARQA